MNLRRPTPAIASQDAAVRLPRIVIFLCVLAYLIPGFIGRAPWRSADMVGLAAMQQMAQGKSSWLMPSVLGVHVSDVALLPYWLGAWAIKYLPFLDLVIASRIPFMLLLLIAMCATWYACYYLAMSPQAQPVPFAFGGEAQPKAYARVMADGGLLALMAAMGLAQLSHETTPAMTQLAMTSLMFVGSALLMLHPRWGLFAFAIGSVGLALSGAANLTWLFGVGSLLIYVLNRQESASMITKAPPHARWSWVSLGMGLSIAIALVLAYALHSWTWPHGSLAISAQHWRGLGELFLWFLWPLWPLTLWTLWRWRGQLLSRQLSRHIALPFWFAIVSVVATFVSQPADRALLLALPAIGCLSAFALPTMKREITSFIDWFTLIFFTSAAVIIWVMWFSLQTGIPRQPSANLMRLAPGYIQSPTQLWVCGVALAATIIWMWLVRWRVIRHRKAMWSSLVLPAGGTTLCWLLLMTLWLPVLNYTQGYEAMMRTVQSHVLPNECVEVRDLGKGKIAALSFYLHNNLHTSGLNSSCDWLATDPVTYGNLGSIPPQINENHWSSATLILSPTSPSESILLLQKKR